MKIALIGYIMFLFQPTRNRNWTEYRTFQLTSEDVKIIKAHMKCKLRPIFQRMH